MQIKRLLAALLAAVLLLTLVACGGGDTSTDTPATDGPAANDPVADVPENDFVLDIDALDAEIQAANLFIDQLEPMSENVVTNVCMIDVSGCTKFVYYMGSGATGEEYGIFECADEAAAKDLLEQVKTHQDDLYTTYEAYAADALPRIENAVATQVGRYVVFISANEYDAAQALADKALTQ